MAFRRQEGSIWTFTYGFRSRIPLGAPLKDILHRHWVQWLRWAKSLSSIGCAPLSFLIASRSCLEEARIFRSLHEDRGIHTRHEFERQMVGPAPTNHCYYMPAERHAVRLRQTTDIQ
ncbi:hypothetical protein BS47DRAFT_1340954 [Hydnum rufescens UP504]|uniref:Uncharacterized protein n=1 Tax=Hydnum rufescens UP504 TaxID=1448309 RepID=A0A9P6B295_9AGAM|nr:hypothetical protein BS47DRAFT_1340954 [Hydnum rufescens UP504]